jgi:hypothetical protein
MAIRSTFKPEFLNRLDDIILFDSLSRRAIESSTSDSRGGAGWSTVGYRSTSPQRRRSGSP